MRKYEVEYQGSTWEIESPHDLDESALSSIADGVKAGKYGVPKNQAAVRDARSAGYQQGYGEKLVERASKEIGKTSYVWGGCKPGQTDCSGFTQGVAKDMGFDLPRTAQEQFKKSTKVSVPEAGDYVFMKTPSRKHAKGTEITHVGIYDGKGNLIHNSSSKKGVVSVPLSSMQKYVKGYGRIGDFEKGLGVTPYEERAAQANVVPKKEGLTGAIKAMKMLDDLDAKKEKEANALIKRNAEVLGKKQFAAPNDQNREDRDRLYAEANSVGLGEDPILFDTIRNMNTGELALMVTTGNMPEGFPEIGKYSASAEKAQRFALNQLTQKMGGSSLPGQLISGVLTSPLHIASEVQTLLETGTASYSTGDKAKAAFNIALGVGTADLTFPQGAFGPELLKVLDNEIAAMTKAGGKNVGKLREARQMLVKGYEIDERGTIKKVADFLGVKSTPNPNTVANLDLTKPRTPKAPESPVITDSKVYGSLQEAKAVNNPPAEAIPTGPKVVVERNGKTVTVTRGANARKTEFKKEADAIAYEQAQQPSQSAPKAEPPKVDTATTPKVASPTMETKDVFEVSGPYTKSHNAFGTGTTTESQTIYVKAPDGRVEAILRSGGGKYTGDAKPVPYRWGTDKPPYESFDNPEDAIAAVKRQMAQPKNTDTATPTVVKETPKKPETVKEPWETSRAEFKEAERPSARFQIQRSGTRGAYTEQEWLDQVAGNTHSLSVEQALKDGKPVPAEVLADYPDLVAKYAKEPSVKVDDAVSPKTTDRLLTYSEWRDKYGDTKTFNPKYTPNKMGVVDVDRSSSIARGKNAKVQLANEAAYEKYVSEWEEGGGDLSKLSGVDDYGADVFRSTAIWVERTRGRGAADDLLGRAGWTKGEDGRWSQPKADAPVTAPKVADVAPTKVAGVEAPKAEPHVELTGQARIDAAKERIKSRTGSGIKNKSAGAVSPITKEDWQRLGDNIQDYLEIAYGHIENGVTKIQNLRNALIKDGIPENEALLTADIVTGKSMPRATKRELAKRGLLGKLETSKRVVVDPDNLNPINIDEKIRLMNTFTKDQAKRGGDILTPEDYEAVRMFAKGLQNDLQSLGERSVKGEDVSTEFSDKFLKYMEATTALEYSASARGFALNQVKTRTQRYKAKAVYEDVLRVALKRDLTKEERQFAKQMAETVAEKETKWIAAKKSAQTTKHLDAAVQKIKSAPKYSEQQVKDAMKRLQQDLVAPVSSILGMGAAGGGRGFDDIVADLRIVLDPVWTKVKSFGELFDHARPLIHESQMADEDLIDALQTIVGTKYRQAKMSKAWGDDFLQEGKDVIQDASIPEYKKDIENIWQDAQKLYDLDDPNNYDFYDDFGKKMADAESVTDPKAQRKAYGKIAQWLNTGRLDAEDFLIRGNSGVTDPNVAQARLELDDAINKAEMMLNQSYKASWPEKISTWMDLNKLTDPQNRVVDLLSGVHFFADLPATTIAKMSDRVLSTIGFTPSMSFLSVKDKIEALKNIKLRSELAKSAGAGQVGDVARNKVVFTSRIGKAFETSVKKAVSSMDVIPRATARPYVERELATLWAKKEGMTTADALGYRVEELLNDTPPELRREIEATIDEVNFSADNLLSQLKTSSLHKLNSIVKNEAKSNAEQLSAGAAYVLLNATFGFTRVFSNIAQYSLEYAGGGLVPAIRGSVMAGGIVKRTASRVKAGEGALLKLLKEEMGNVPASQMRKLNVAIGRGASGMAIAAIMGNIFYDQKWLEPQTVDAKRGIIDYGFWEQMPGPFKAIVEQCRLRFLSDQLKGDKPGAAGAITVEQYKNLIGQPRQDDLDALNKIVELRAKGTITEEEAIKRFKNQMVRPVSIPGVTSLSPKQALEVMMSQPLLTNMAKITNQRIEEVEDYLARQSLSALPLSGAVIGAQRAKDQGIPFIGKYIGLKGDGVYSRRSGNFVESAMKRIPFLADKFPSKANAYSIFGVKDNDPLVKELQLLGMVPQVRKKQITLPSGVRTSEATKDMDARVMDYLKKEYENLSKYVQKPAFKAMSIAQKKNGIKEQRKFIRKMFEDRNKEVPDLEE